MSAPSNDAPTAGNEAQTVKYGAVGAPVRPRCHITHDENIDVVCHNCGRPISLADEAFRKDSHYRWWLRKRYPKDKKSKPSLLKKALTRSSNWLYLRNQEFTNLGLKDDTAVHCEQCHHPNELPLLLGSLLLIAVPVCIVLVAKSPVPFLYALFSLFMLLIFSILIISIVNYIDFWYLKSQTRPLFPLIGRAPVIKVNEYLAGKIDLDESGQSSPRTDLHTAYGEIKTEIQVTGADRKRLEKFRKMYIRAGISQRVHYLIGFLLFEHVRAIKFDEASYQAAHKPVPLLIQSSAFAAQWSSNNGTTMETVTQKYQIYFSDKDKADIVPIQIIPAIISEGTNRIEAESVSNGNGIRRGRTLRTGLELIVQVNPKVWVKSFLQSDVTVQELKVEINPPSQFGRVHVSVPPSDPESTENCVVWKGEKLQQHDEKSFYEELGVKEKDAKSKVISPSKRFFVRFENSFEPETKIHGTLVAKVSNTISGIDDVKLFDPLGYKVDKKKRAVKRETEVTLEFSFSLNHLKIRQNISPHIEPETKDVIPDRRIVNMIIDKLIEDNVTYVQRVFENPPQTNQADAYTLNRFWDIGGREYDGTFPMNFHIMLSGWQKYNGRDRPETGKTTFDIEITSTLTTEEIGYKVRPLQERLEGIIEHCVEEWQRLYPNEI